MSDDAIERGVAVRRRIAGDETVDRELANLTDFDRPFYDLVTTGCFADVWGRDDLDPKTRALVTVAICGALARPGALNNHIRNALRHGASMEELREVALHIAIYAGVPAGGQTMGAIKEILKETGAL